MKSWIAKAPGKMLGHEKRVGEMVKILEELMAGKASYD
jgi:hypothetical protein